MRKKIKRITENEKFSLAVCIKIKQGKIHNKKRNDISITDKETYNT